MNIYKLKFVNKVTFMLTYCFSVIFPLFVSIDATITPLDNSVPYLVSGGRALVWSAGVDALSVAGSSFVRVNERGIVTQPSHWSVRDLRENGWRVRRCLPGGGSLCEMSNVSRVFPTDPNKPRFSASHTLPPLRCTRDRAQRILDHNWGYDISACDVLDGGGDVVFFGHSVAFMDTEITQVKYWLLCVLAIFIVRSFSYKVKTRLEYLTSPNTLGFSSDQWTIGACALSIILAITPNFTSELVTEEDFICCCFLVFYSFLYIMVWVFNRHDPHAPIYNLIAVTLQVTASRLYKGIETPYGGVLLYVLMTRMFMKLIGGWKLPHAITVACDSILVSLLAVFGTPFDGIYVVIIAIAAFGTADLLQT